MHLRFDVDTLEVRRDGWSVEIAVTNSTDTAFEPGRPDELEFGLMLFDTGELEELTKAAEAGTLPPMRRARSIEPPLPHVLRPGATWHATLSAPGSLADGSWVRVSFGPFDAVGDATGGHAGPRRLDHGQGPPAVATTAPLGPSVQGGADGREHDRQHDSADDEILSVQDEETCPPATTTATTPRHRHDGDRDADSDDTDADDA